VIKAHTDFHLVISYNPGYQSVLKDLKESTKQRFGAINFTYPEPAVEAEIVSQESAIDIAVAHKLVKIAERSRSLKGHGLEEGCSTRMLIHVVRLVNRGIPLGEACEIALVSPLTDDVDIRRALGAAIAACA
jgi:nitric oxide reductase NorQ protein